MYLTLNCYSILRRAAKFFNQISDIRNFVQAHRVEDATMIFCNFFKTPSKNVEFWI